VIERQNISSGSPWELKIGSSRAVRINDRILVTGTAPVWPDGSCDPDPVVQTRRCFERIAEALAKADATLDDVVFTRTYLTDAVYGDAAAAVHSELFSDTRPAATFVVVKELLDPRWKLEIEVEAVRFTVFPR
jgi:enamine deaminase RidA (YjgF/YER057c/UK114 family)